MAKKQSETGEELVTVRLTTEGRNLIKLIKRRYRGIAGMTQARAFVQFMEENHPDLLNEAKEATEIERRYNDIFGDDDDD